MQPPSVINSSNTKNYLTPEHRARLGQLLNDLDDDQLQLVLTNHLPNSSLSHQFQHYTRVQLFQQCLVLIENYYSIELEQTLYTMRQKHFPSDFYQQQTNFPTSFNQQSYHYTQPNYRLSSSPAISQQLRTSKKTFDWLFIDFYFFSLVRPNLNSNLRSHPLPPQQQSPYIHSLLSQQQQQSRVSNNSTIPLVQRYQVPLLPPPSSSSSQSPLILPSTNNPPRLPINKIVHKILPFYRPITCVHERYYIFHYDQYRKQHMSLDEFTLSFDVCNQLALSYDYDPNLNIHKTSKCLLLRLARIDQPPTCNGKYDDNLPPNLVIHINGHTLTNLPIPKACTRQQNDLMRIGREIDITSNCMFNPILKNEIKIAWSYRQDNTNLHLQYGNAQYALHVFLVEHVGVEELCEQIRKKSSKFFREDLIKLLTKARANDRDLGLEVSDQKLKLICPIDQRRLKKPIRATTCQHLQCFDLTNYIGKSFFYLFNFYILFLYFRFK
jgi:hypothetical protein